MSSLASQGLQHVLCVVGYRKVEVPARSTWLWLSVLHKVGVPAEGTAHSGDGGKGEGCKEGGRLQEEWC